MSKIGRPSMRDLTREFGRNVFRGKTPLLLQAGVGGAIGGIGAYVLSSVLSKHDPLQAMDPRLVELTAISVYDASLYNQCTRLLQLVEWFVPSCSRDVLELMAVLDALGTCMEAAYADPVRFREVPWLSHMLSERAEQLINSLTAEFPVGRRFTKDAIAILQDLFDAQGDMAGMARMAVRQSN